MAPMPSRYCVRAAVLAVALALLAGCGDGDGGGAGTPTTATTATTAAGDGPELGPASSPIAALPGALKTGPPWPANNGPTLQLRLRALGFQPLTEEGQVVHIHQHLDLFVDGKQVTVPANMGIDADGGFISDLHTHDTSGIMHVESPTQRDFTLGQFFAVWGLPLSARCIGSRCEEEGTGACVGAACDDDSEQLRVFVNGNEVEGDPTRVKLAEHQEIAIAFGTAAQMPDPVPDSFDFAAVGL